MAMVDVWSCPECTAVYRMPSHWEAAVFLAARRAAQTIHASRHGRSALEVAIDRRPGQDENAASSDRSDRRLPPPDLTSAVSAALLVQKIR